MPHASALFLRWTFPNQNRFAGQKAVSHLQNGRIRR